MYLRTGSLALLVALLVARPAMGEGATGTVSGTVLPAEGSGPILVYLAEVPRAARERTPRRTTPRARIEQKGRQFVPSSLVVQQGQMVEFVNRDRGYHSVFSLTPGNEFDLGLGQDGEPRAVEMRGAGEVVVHCDLHPEMAARILVLQNDFQVQVAPDGTYALRDVPPGSYTLVTWSLQYQTERRRVRVYESGVTKADFALKPRKSPEARLGRRGGMY